MSVDAAAVTRWAADSLLNGSLQGAVAIGLIWFASRRFPFVPASVQAAIWWLVSLKLVLVLLPIPALSIPLLPAQTRYTLVQATLSRSQVTTVSTHADSPAAAHELRETTGPANAVSVNRWLVTLIQIWFVALGMQAVRLLFALRALQAIVRRSAPPADRDIAVINDLARAMGLSRLPRVRVSAEVDTPQLIGVRRPIVLVPAEATVPPASERAMALCHELMHIRRHDLALGWVPALAGRLFFFHPLVRLAAREYITAREAACDAAVVRALGVSPGEYGRLLIRAGVARSVPAFAATAASASTASLRRRLEMLQYVGSSVVSRRAMRCLAVVAFAAMLPFQLVAKTPPRDAVAPSVVLVGDVSAFKPVVTPMPAALETSRDSATRQAAHPRAVEQALIEERRAAEKLSRRLAAQEELQRKLRELDEKIAREIVLQQQRQHVVQAAQEREIKLRQMLQEAARRGEAERARLIRTQVELEQRRLQEHLAATQRQLEASTRTSSRNYSRNHIVTVAPDADGTRQPNARVVAVAGDRVQVARTGIVVNDVPVAGLSSEFLAGLPAEAWDRTVPSGHYFVVAEQRSDSGVSRFWGLIPAERIIGKP